MYRGKFLEVLSSRPKPARQAQWRDLLLRQLPNLAQLVLFTLNPWMN